jgi:hypothetical protein
MFKQGLYQFVPSLKISPVSVLWTLALVAVLIGIASTAPLP